MAWNTPAVPIALTAITVAFYRSNIYQNLLELDLRTGAASPSAASLVTVSTGAGVTAWGKVPSAAFNDNTIDGIKMLAASINGSKIIANTVTANEIAASAITASELANSAVNDIHILANTINGDARMIIGSITGNSGTSAIPVNGISSNRLPNGALTAAEFSRLVAASSVLTTHVADANITTVKIADANVTTIKIADANVTTVKIADANVTTVKIADGNVTAAKLATDATPISGDHQGGSGALLTVYNNLTSAIAVPYTGRYLVCGTANAHAIPGDGTISIQIFKNGSPLSYTVDLGTCPTGLAYADLSGTIFYSTTMVAGNTFLLAGKKASGGSASTAKGEVWYVFLGA